MGIPLAALASQPQPQVLDQANKALAFKTGLQNQQFQQQMQPIELQQQQQRAELGKMQLQDQQAVTAAMKNWDGKDIEELPGLVLKQGGSAQAVFGLKNQIIEQKKNLAQADEATLGNQAKTNDLIAGHIEAVKGAPAEQKQQAYSSAISDLQQKGLIKPGMMPAQYPGDDALNLIEKSFMGQKQIVEQEQNERKVKAQESEANTKAVTAQTGLARLQAEMPGGPLNRVTQDRQIQTDPAIQQGKINVAAAEGAARAQVEANAARGSNAALAQVPPHLVGPASAAADKAGQDYAQAKSVSDRLAAMMDAAKKGNVVSYQLIPQEGALQVTTSQGVHRINMAEIQNYGGGSLWQRLEGHLGKQLTGKSIPDSVLNDMAEMQKIQSVGSQTKYNNALKTINQTYGSAFQPVQMEGMPQAPSASPSSAPGKTLSRMAIQRAAKDHGISEQEAEKQAQAAGYTIQ